MRSIVPGNLEGAADEPRAHVSIVHAAGEIHVYSGDVRREASCTRAAFEVHEL
jgi:hypothetical protein